MEISQLEYYRASAKNVSLVEIPTMKFLSFDGEGRPENVEFQEAAQTLYTISYLMKFALPREERVKVSPMEVRWFLNREEKIFQWTMMIRQPDLITEERVEKAIEEANAKKKTCYPERMRLESFAEGYCAQILHRGPYSEMNSTLMKMKDHLDGQGLDCEQDTHDIYLNDLRKTRPENLRTIMRVKILPK